MKNKREIIHLQNRLKTASTQSEKDQIQKELDKLQGRKYVLVEEGGKKRVIKRKSDHAGYEVERPLTRRLPLHEQIEALEKLGRVKVTKHF